MQKTYQLLFNIDYCLHLAWFLGSNWLGTSDAVSASKSGPRIDRVAANKVTAKKKAF